MCDPSGVEAEVGGQRSAIVTGAASGIGAAVAARLVRAGWRAIGLDRSAGVEVVGDAADPAVLGEALSRAGERLDGLVCSAGLPPSGPWDARDDWDEILRVNLTAPYRAFRSCHAALAAAGGSVVLVGSIVGAVEGSRRSPAYAASKAGLEGLARSLALVGAADGIRVNVVAAGAVDTPFDELLAPADDRPDVPLGRMARAEEVASVIEFLLGEEASYVTGAVWRVDGGRTVQPGIDLRPH
ncbi:MAG: SDR family NAD(P)-dependent oxidoreductase [Candidatus Limnocylindria bacterium]